ncbi:DNA-binding protein [Rhizobiales bacterium RZME27]|uniref:DNA-binding protein n=1 Tax=Endobacterium cereale TaxID=2663029 RepID=A0A6A8A743_9HYPH|nr:DNA-binding protein [Endobacterium cereale]MQY46599.1 DNA-binding protein [Endobacterium cereale]
MDHVSNPQHAEAHTSLTSRRLAKGYSLDDLAIATGLTVEEITSTEEGRGLANHVGRIEGVLK